MRSQNHDGHLFLSSYARSTRLILILLNGLSSRIKGWVKHTPWHKKKRKKYHSHVHKNTHITSRTHSWSFCLHMNKLTEKRLSVWGSLQGCRPETSKGRNRRIGASRSPLFRCLSGARRGDWASWIHPSVLVLSFLLWRLQDLKEKMIVIINV